MAIADVTLLRRCLRCIFPFRFVVAVVDASEVLSVP